MIAVKAPSVGESITEVSILKWHKQNGEAVKVGEVLLEIESDKATVEIVAEGAGVLQILKPQGERINVGTVIGQIDPAGKATATSAAKSAAPAKAATPPAPSASMVAAAPAQMSAPAPFSSNPHSALPLSPAARKAIVENHVDPAQVSGTGKDGRLTKGDVLNHVNGGATKSPLPTPATPTNPGDRRVPMSMLRQRIAERLVQAQHTAAILTTFNEVDMTAVMELRNKHKDAFKAKNGVPLSFMSFFTIASIEALKLVPEVNASIDGKDMIYHDYFDIGIAVGTERGLVVPVIRGAEKMKVVDIEKRMGELATKARDGKLGIADMTGGTFTISNGGVYGSLLSTPILNPPQSGILGMHNIVERPMAIDGKVVIRPMMYVALSYDHRIVDGKGAVTFLVKLKEFLEHPDKLKLTF